MAENVIKDVIIMDMVIYWLLTIVLLWFMDIYAKKKLGKTSMGYKALRIPKFIALAIGSLFTIMFVIMAMIGVNISQATLTYFGVPYFAAWIFYLTSVLRRVRAEKVRRLNN